MLSPRRATVGSGGPAGTLVVALVGTLVVALMGPLVVVVVAAVVVALMGPPGGGDDLPFARSVRHRIYLLCAACAIVFTPAYR